MNTAHLHLVITHLPVLGSLFGLILLTLGMIRKSDELQRTSLGVFVIAALLAVPAYFTGRPASEVLMKAVPMMSVDAGDKHAEIAILALAGAALLGVAGLTGLALGRRGKPLPRGFTVTTLLLALITTGLMGWTANLGGQVRHTEIRPETPSQTAQ